MTASGTTKLTTGALKFLPAKLRKRWTGSRVYYRILGDTLVVKRTRPAIIDFAYAMKQFRKLGKTVTRRDVQAAITAERRKR